ncbi:MAG: hypothetical protein RMJ87_13295 [Cytophagales bacterium]|nr:hypothetical protein [Bernardetiaceae bacterium]MDW8205997.1 hypothetical protein [Cytophagales bacterium]
MKRLFAVLWCLLGVAESCTSPVQPFPSNRESGYFSIASEIDRQVALLTASNAKGQKIVQVGAAPPDTVSLQATNWENELYLFKEADINKPAWIDAYEVIQSADKTVYRATHSVPLVRQVMVRGTLSQPTVIEAHMVQSNLLYHTEKHLQLVFEEGKLSTYRIEGFQKSLLADTTQYKLIGVVH